MDARSARARAAVLRCSGTLAIALLAGSAAANPSASLQVGALTLHRCHTPAPWCGQLARRLDPSGALPGMLSIYFEFYPHRAPGPPAGTLVATEGGPGYPATGSRSEYLALFDPLRSDRDVLIMDNRGTGRSGALDCEPLQNAPELTTAGIGACGRSLGPAAPLYSTALAADDLAALLDALSIARIDLYGDSYGTYFAQVFALRHHERLRSLVLDGAYPLDGPDYPWYPHYAPATRDKFNLACERAPACRRIPGSSIEHIAPALALLRTQAFEARVRYGSGQSLSLRADPSRLAIVMFGGSPAYATLRETDAAARAFVAGDRVPLLRLMAETQASVDSRDPTHSPREFSAALAAAVFCQDPPQIFDMSLAPAARRAARDAALAQRRAAAPGAYAPFSLDEYRRMPLDYAFIEECLEWPRAQESSPAVPLVPPGARYPDVPVLVVSGEFDNMTSVADGTAAAARFPRAHHVVIANSFHVNALPHARSDCGAALVRRFLERLDPGDESCAAAVPALTLVERFARHARELAPMQPLAGNEADEARLRIVSAVLLTCADVVVHAAKGGSRGVGLRGGDFEVAHLGDVTRATLHELLWTEDTAVSGRIEWRRGGTVEARVRVRGPRNSSGRLELAWPADLSEARATAHGELAGTAVAAAAAAP